ncbi:MAG: hypothetical protein JXR75_12360 [Rhodobacteraceae bacterium]|nr:hypothetical protein [Paracoccaceae bacterium]
MNQVAKIEETASTAYSLRAAHRSDDFLKIMPPAEDTEWHPLPAILDGITFAARFIGSSKMWGHHRAYLDHVHVARGKVIATDGKCLVEYSVGECPDFSILPVQVAQITAFGEAPSHVNLDSRLKLKWANGNYLITKFRTFPELVEQVTPLIAAHDWDDFIKMDPDWRDQIIGRFSYKSAPDRVGYKRSKGLVYFTPDRIVGGMYDFAPDIELRMVTHTKADVAFDQKQLLRALKVADEFKFVHGDVSYFLFKAPNVRGVIALDRPVDPVPVLS